MADSPKPPRFAKSFFYASVCVLMGAWALRLAFAVLQSIAPFLICSLLLALLVGALRLIRRRGSDKSW